MESEEIQRIIKLMPVVKHSINTDATISLIGKDRRVIHVDHAKSFNMKTKDGDIMREDDPALEIFKTKKVSNYTLPEELFGEPIYGKFIPIFSETSNDVIAVLATAYSLKKQNEIESSTNNLNSSLEQTENTIEEFAGDIQSLASSINEIQNITKLVETKVNEVNAFIKTIRDNASTSKILALNASIEAARAGDSGRGFNVVASEMGRLAQSSGDTSTKITASLMEMFSNLAVLATSVQSANEVATTQAATIEEITATLESITAESEVLATMAKEQ